MTVRHWIAVGAIAAAVPLSASAEQAFTVRGTDVYAGPSSDFPSIAQLAANVSVNVAGCLSDWNWCDVTFSNDRGWVYAADIAAEYQGRPVVIIDSGPRIQLPVVAFSLPSYWEQHYRSKPFYGERQQWVGRVHVEGGHGGKAPEGHERADKSMEPEKSRIESSQNQRATGMTESRPPAQAQGQQAEHQGMAPSQRPDRASRQAQGTASSQQPDQSMLPERRTQQSSRGDVKPQPSRNETAASSAEHAPMGNAKGQSEPSAQRSAKSEPSAKAGEQPPKGEAKGQQNESPKRENEQQ